MKVLGTSHRRRIIFEMNDNQFIERIQNIRGRMYKIAYTYCKNEEDAKELISSTVYNAYKSLGKMLDEKYFETWVIRILINQCHQFSRKKKNIIQSSLDTFSDFLQVKEENLDITEKLDLYEAVDSLDGPVKTTIILKYFEDLTIKQTAEHMDVPESRVKNYLNKGLKELRKKLRSGY